MRRNNREWEKHNKKGKRTPNPNDKEGIIKECQRLSGYEKKSSDWEREAPGQEEQEQCHILIHLYYFSCDAYLVDSLRVLVPQGDESACLSPLAFREIKGLTKRQFFPSGLSHLATPQQQTSNICTKSGASWHPAPARLFCDETSAGKAAEATIADNLWHFWFLWFEFIGVVNQGWGP